MEKRINNLKNEAEILRVLKEFSLYLKSLKKGAAYQQDMAKKFANSAEFFVVTIEEKWAGFIAFYANDLYGKIAYISMLAVHDVYRRRGIGKFLLEECIKKAKISGMTKLRLEVAKSNTNAIAFYENNHFKLLEKRDSSYYMERNLME